MAKPPNEARSLADAIARLEAIGQNATQDLKERLGTDFEQVLETLESLKPQLEELKSSATSKAGEAKSELENQIKQNPWIMLGVVGILGLIVGWFMGQSKKR